MTTAKRKPAKRKRSKSLSYKIDVNMRTPVLKTVDVNVHAPSSKDLDKLRVLEKITDGLCLIARRVCDLQTSSRVSINGDLDIAGNLTIGDKAKIDFPNPEHATVTFLTNAAQKK